MIRAHIISIDRERRLCKLTKGGSPGLYRRGKSLSQFLFEPIDFRVVVGNQHVAYRWKVSGQSCLPRYVEVRSLKSRKDTQSHERSPVWRQSCSYGEEEEDSGASDVGDSLASNLRLSALH